MGKLTDIAIRKAKPTADGKPVKLADGGGLTLVVTLEGGEVRKRWRWRYRRPVTQKENMLGLGVYPEVSLAEARARHAEGRRLLTQGVDPSDHKRATKAATLERASNSLEVVALEWLAKKDGERVGGSNARSGGWFRNYVFPYLGARPVSDVEPKEVLAVLKRIAGKGHLDTAHRVRAELSAMYRYAIATDRASRDPAAPLSDALPRPQERHFAGITNPAEFGKLLRVIDGYDGDEVTRQCLRMTALLFQRPSEVRGMRWEEVDLDARLWRIPPKRQKLSKAKKENVRTPDHIVPLPEQAVAILRDLQPLTGRWEYVFTSHRDRTRPISENTPNAALKRLGYFAEVHTVHGFRHSASTMLNEMGWSPDAIERQLSHGDPNKIRGTYNHAQYLEERRTMVQAWADYLDGIRNGAEVVPLRAKVA